MSQAPIMPLVTDALIGDTTSLSTEEFGAYLLILIATWRNNGKAFPDNDARMARICRSTLHRWRKTLRPALIGFFDLSEGTFRQKRLEKEWVSVISRIEANRKNGMAGGRPNVMKKKETEKPVGCVSDNPDDNPDGTEIEPIHIQIQIQKEEGNLDHLPTKPESTESSNRARAPAAKGAQKGEYVFRRRIIRLTKADFEGWQKTYFTIADLRAKLESLDCFYDQNLTGADRSKWFFRCSAALDKEHQANLKTQAPPSSIDRMALARSRYPHIATERLQELAKSSGCTEYGPRGEYQAWQILRYGEVR